MTNQKWATLVIYILMLVVVIVNPGGSVGGIIPWVFLGVAAVHLLEFALVLAVLRAAGGSMANHFLHTMLFGFMHWKPIKDAMPDAQ